MCDLFNDMDEANTGHHRLAGKVAGKDLMSEVKGDDC
jgi:hypothetical protein